MARGVAAMRSEVFKQTLLRRVVVGHGESYHLFKGQLAFAVRLENDRAHAGQFQQLPHGDFRSPETGRNLGGRVALVHEVAERLELVGRVHVFPHDILGKADFARVEIAVLDFAADAVGGPDIARLGKQTQGFVAAASRDNGEVFALPNHIEVLQQAVRPDAVREFRDRAFAVRLADVSSKRHELVEGDFDDGHDSSPFQVLGLKSRRAGCPPAGG